MLLRIASSMIHGFQNSTKYIFTAILFCCLNGTLLHAQKVSQADSIWFEETATKINQNINEKPETADSLARIYFAKARKLNNDEYSGKGACLVQMGVSMLEPENAKGWYDTAQIYLQRSKNYLWNGYLNLNYGIILNRKYFFESGIAYLNKSIQYFERAKDTIQMAHAYSDIANAFHDFGNYEKGKEYARKGLKLIESQKEPAGNIAWYLWNVLAINYDDNKEYDNAIATHLKALDLAKGNDRFLASTYNNLGNTYKKKGMLAEAGTYFQKSFQKEKILQRDYQYATLYGNLGDVALKQQNYALARKYLDSCLFYSEKSGSPEKLKDAYEYNANWYEATGDFKNSLRFIKLNIVLKDSLENIAKAGIIYDAQERYESTKKDKENQALQIANQLKTLEKDKAVSEKKITITVSAILLISLSALALLLYRNQLNKIKRSEEQKMNQALFEGEQKERIRIARDLHDSVGQMLSLAKMNLSAFPDKQLLPTTHLIDSTISEVRSISHNLIPEDLNFGIFAALETLAEKINHSHTTQMSVSITEDVRHLKFERQNELSIYRILQEVVGNIIRHSGANNIDLTVTQQGQKMLFSIKDNGKGMDPRNIANSKGIGWKNIKARVNLLDGKMKVRSEKLTGTQIEILLPQHG